MNSRKFLPSTAKSYVKFYHFLVALCTIVAAMTFQSVRAQVPVLTISQSTSGNKTTFTIRRQDASSSLFLKCRTISLSAIAGKHFTEPNDVLTFSKNEYEKTVTVEEKAPDDIDELYLYQNGTSRTYRFVVHDTNGFVLASADRTITYDNAYKITYNYVNQQIRNLIYFNGSNYASAISKYVDVTYNPNTNSQHKRSGDYVRVTDKDLYGEATLCNISTSSLFTTAGIPQHYLNSIGNKMYATVAFTMKEKNDGYQYIQILTDERESYDGSDPDGDLNTPIYARYKASFELSKSSPSVVTDDHKMFFPHRYNSNSGSNEFEYSDSYLYKQLFRDAAERPYDCGALILSPSVNEINVRFDARGKDDDDWFFKNLFVRLALLDDAKPTLIDVPYVSPGSYKNETDFYISVPFSEIVTVTGIPTLTTSWGTASYCAGTGTNVLTFKGKINAERQTHLQITRINTGNNEIIKDLAGNEFTESLTYDGFADDVKVFLISLTDMNTQFIGLESEYPFSGKSVEPRPTAVYFYKGTWDDANRTTLVEGTDYTISWYNNYFAPSNAYITIYGKDNYSASAKCYFNLRNASYTVHFDANGGEGTMSNQAFTYGTAQKLNANAFTLNDYTFAGWTTNADGSGTSYTDKQQVKNLTTVDGATVTLYAQWTLATYIINYDLNGGQWPSGQTGPENFTILTEDFTLPIPVREGCRFAGWTGTGLDTLTLNIEIPRGSTGDREYKAHWIDTWGVIDEANESNGTKEHPYVISTTEGLNLLAERVNAGNGYATKYFVLGADIAYDPKALTIDADGNGTADSNYTPIGTGSNSFRGNFDGQNHTISGIRINNPQSDCQGLFGNAVQDTIKNIILADARITGYYSVGGIVAYNKRSTIENCHVTQDVVINGNISCGGIAGNNMENINGCTSAATINGSYCGGIVGRNWGSVNDCLAIDVTLPTHKRHVGTIVGQNEERGILSHNFYHGGNHKGCGGEEEDIDIPGEAEQGYFITLEEGITIQDGEVATFTIPAHKELNTGGIALVDVAAKTYYVAANETAITLAYTNLSQIYKAVFHYTDTEGTHNIDENVISMPNHDIAVSVDFVFDGWNIANGADGSADHPYIITCPEELNYLSTMVNAGNSYKGKHFVLGADIAYDPIDTDGDGTTGDGNYTPIGKDSSPFSGTFDGQGHTISGIRIGKVAGGFSPALFNTIDDGVVRNVILADTRIMGILEVGGIAYENKGTIENCHIAYDVVLEVTEKYNMSESGSIAVRNYGTINGCTSAVTINGSNLNYVIGGIVGKNYGIVSNCRAIAVNINQKGRADKVGTIVGQNIEIGTVKNNYYYNCTNIYGTGDGDIKENNGAMPTEGVPLLETYSNDYVLAMCQGESNYTDFTLAGHNYSSIKKDTLSHWLNYSFLCLPFVIRIQDFFSIIHNYFDLDFYSFDREATQVRNDTLMLHFKKTENYPMDSPRRRVPVGVIPAGTPFVIKWYEKVLPSTLTFFGKILYDLAPTTVTNFDGTVTFRGGYNPESLTAGQGTYYFNPTDKTLCWPGRKFNINAFYPWIEAKSDKPIHSFKIQFEDDECVSETGYYTNLPTASSSDGEGDSGAWYDLQGRKIANRASTMPKGIYLHNGRKVVVK